jgi:hypothetical protein
LTIKQFPDYCLRYYLQFSGFGCFRGQPEYLPTHEQICIVSIDIQFSNPAETLTFAGLAILFSILYRLQAISLVFEERECLKSSDYSGESVLL